MKPLRIRLLLLSAVVCAALCLLLPMADADPHEFGDWVETPAAQARTALGECVEFGKVCKELCDINGPTGDFACMLQ